MIYVYLVTTRMKFEYSDNHSERKWTDSSNLYCFKTEKEARLHCWHLKQKEAKEYSKWLKQNQNTRGMFIHHTWNIEKHNVFDTAVTE